MPTATICTDEFVSLGRTEAQALGMPGLPLVVIPHPLGGLRPEEVRAKAEGAIDEIVYVLTQPAEKLAAEYREQRVEPKSKFRPKPLFA